MRRGLQLVSNKGQEENSQRVLAQEYENTHASVEDYSRAGQLLWTLQGPCVSVTVTDLSSTGWFM